MKQKRGNALALPPPHERVLQTTTTGRDGHQRPQGITHRQHKDRPCRTRSLLRNPQEYIYIRRSRRLSRPRQRPAAPKFIWKICTDASSLCPHVRSSEKPLVRRRLITRGQILATVGQFGLQPLLRVKSWETKIVQKYSSLNTSYIQTHISLTHIFEILNLSLKL